MGELGFLFLFFQNCDIEKLEKNNSHEKRRRKVSRIFIRKNKILEISDFFKKGENFPKKKMPIGEIGELHYSHNFCLLCIQCVQTQLVSAPCLGNCQSLCGWAP